MCILSDERDKKRPWDQPLVSKQESSLLRPSNTGSKWSVQLQTARKKRKENHSHPGLLQCVCLQQRIITRVCWYVCWFCMEWVIASCCEIVLCWLTSLSGSLVPHFRPPVLIISSMSSELFVIYKSYREALIPLALPPRPSETSEGKVWDFQPKWLWTGKQCWTKLVPKDVSLFTVLSKRVELQG